ncbi:MAG: ion transporter [Coprobacillus sp.]
MYNKIKNRVFNTIRDDDENDFISTVFDTVIITLIILSIISVILSTFDNIPGYISTIMHMFEYISISIFTIEYLLRLWTSDLYYSCGPLKSRIKYIFSFMAIIDLISILPFYIPFIIKTDLRSLRTIRLVRVFRIFKLHRYTAALNSVIVVFKKKKEQLISSVFVVFVLMIISSIFMYYCEHDVQPDKFENAFSGLWWAVATLTTVGYGDIYPITVLGKIISTFLALLGIGLVAVPTGIISAGFSEELIDSKEDESKKDINYCPHCGKKIK